MNNNENPNTSVEEVSAVALDHLNDIQFNNALDRWVDRLGGYVSFLFLISVGISFYEIISRYFFNAPTIWVHESTTMICALCMAYGGSYCLARNTHISIKMLYDAVGDRGRHCLDIVNALLSVFFLLFNCLCRLHHDTQGIIYAVRHVSPRNIRFCLEPSYTSGCENRALCHSSSNDTTKHYSINPSH
jgi:TRAP-type mannitol/chloroaromatic compound transport system, small permease component